MKVAHMADLHARGKDLISFTGQLNEALRRAEEHNCEAVVVAGDVLDRPNLADRSESAGAIAEVLLNAFAGYPGRVILLVGNHDKAGPGRKDGLHIFGGHGNITVVREPSRIMLGDTSYYCVPWSWDRETTVRQTILSAIVAFPVTKTNVLVAHVSVSGAFAGKNYNYVGTGGWCIGVEELRSLDFDRFVLGDFHKRQDLTEGRGGYVGALRQMNFGEADNPAGFEVYDTETGEVEWVEIECAPKYRTITFREPVDSFPAPSPNEKLRILCDGWAPLDHAIISAEALGVRVDWIVEGTERQVRAAEEDIPQDITTTPAKALDLWAEHQSPVVDGKALTRLQARLESILAGEEAGA